LDYCLINYGKTVTEKKRINFLQIIRRLSAFPEIGFIEPLLKHTGKKYRAIIFDKKYKFIYRIENEIILIEYFWKSYSNPDILKYGLA